MKKIGLPKKGVVFGYLTSLGIRKYENRRSLCLMICKCGNKKFIRTDFLNSCLVTSCGCMKGYSVSEKNTKHGMSYSKIYGVWRAMRQRCQNPKSRHYKYYGARGINICDEWNSFDVFYKEMGDPPRNKNELDRIDNSLGYSRKNCRWANRKTQMRNTRRNIFVVINGERLILKDAMKKYSSVTQKTVSNRLKNGWNITDAILAPRTK